MPIRATGFWPMLLALIAAVLVPTAGVLWFMNEAVINQRSLSRQKLAEAYRTQLALARDRIDFFWEKRAAELDRQAGEGSAAVAFARVAQLGLADSAVVLGADGAVAYPQPMALPAADALQWSEPWLKARALELRGNWVAAAEAYARFAESDPRPAFAARAVQAQIRCLARGGEKARAVAVILRRFGAGPLSKEADLEGRSIAADELLLALHLIRPTQAEFAHAAAALRDLLVNYNSPVPAAQRLFLMSELRGLGAAADFPAYNAEKLASRFTAKSWPRPAESALQPTGLPDVWMLGVAGGRMVALYTTQTVKAALNARELPGALQFALVPPRSPATGFDQAMPAGSWLPGWKVAFSVVGSPVDDLGRKQTLSYFLVGMLAVAIAAVTAVFAGQFLLRQWRVARLKTDLVAAVSHELKTPLSGMRLLVDTLLEDEEFETKKTREYLELIARENLRLSRLIDNFLTFSRLERNRQRFAFRSAQPEMVVNAALEAVRERFQTDDCRLDVAIAAGLPPVHADEDAMVTVLLNLLDNAYKYSPGEKRIALRAFRKDRSVIFAVEDHGIGIAAGERKKIFRRFYQVDRRLSRDVGGCGLGLSIVEFIVRAHGGDVTVISEPGRGSTFSVALPAGASA